MITSIIGSNDFLRRQKLDALTAVFVGEYGDLALERYDGETLEFRALDGAMQSLPFLSPKKLIIVRDLGQNKALAEKLDDILAQDSDSTDLILYETKIDKRSVYYKTLKAKTTLLELTEMDENKLVSWMMGAAKDLGSELSRTDAQYLLERAGANQQHLWSELEKLALYNPINREIIDKLTEPTPSSSIFDLIDAAFSGSRKKLMKIYQDQRAQKIDPAAMLPMVIWQLHILAIVKASGSKSADAVAREAALSPYVVRKTQYLARSVTIHNVREAVQRTTELDRLMKTTQIDSEEALLELLLSLNNKPILAS